LELAISAIPLPHSSSESWLHSQRAKPGDDPSGKERPDSSCGEGQGSDDPRPARGESDVIVCGGAITGGANTAIDTMPGWPWLRSTGHTTPFI